MSLRDIQIRRAMGRALKRALQNGDPPRASHITEAVSKEFHRRAAGAPRFWPAFWQRRKPIPVEDYNRNIEELDQDLSALFEDVNQIRDRMDNIERVLTEEIASVRFRAQELMSRVERLLLLSGKARGFTLWYREDFVNMGGTDSSRTTAIVDVEHQRLSMPSTLIGPKLLSFEDMTINVSSNGEYEIESPLEWMFSSYDNESTEFVITRQADRATLVLDISLHRTALVGRMRVDAVSGSMYGLRIEIETDQGDVMAIHDSIVSFPLELAVNQKIKGLKLVFELTEPVAQAEETRTFRLLINKLDIFEEWTAGEATWVSKPIDLPDHALWGEIDWSGSLDEKGSVDLFVEIYNESQELIAALPIERGSVFPIRAGRSQSTSFSGGSMKEHPVPATLPLWSMSGLFARGTNIIDPKLWIGYNQWKQRMFANEWSEGLSPSHVPGPQDWNGFFEGVIQRPKETILYVDQTSTVFIPDRPADGNVLISLSCYVDAEEETEARFPSFQVQNAKFSLYVNGRRILGDEDIGESTRDIRFPLREGTNSIQLYMITKGETDFGPPLVSFGQIDWGGGSHVRAEREPAIWVDPYQIRKASPSHPRSWVTLDDGAVVVRFNPKPFIDSRAHTKFFMEYKTPSEQGKRSIVIGAQLSKRPAGPGLGPSIQRINLFVSPTGSVRA